MHISKRRTSLSIPPGYPDNGACLRRQTQRQHRRLDPELLRCRLCYGQRQKVDPGVRLHPRLLSDFLAIEEANDDCPINSRSGICGDGTCGKRSDLALISPQGSRHVEVRTESPVLPQPRPHLTRETLHATRQNEARQNPTPFHQGPPRKGTINGEYCPTEDMLGDVMKKQDSLEKDIHDYWG
jgi:hypothetical protein